MGGWKESRLGARRGRAILGTGNGCVFKLERFRGTAALIDLARTLMSVGPAGAARETKTFERPSEPWGGASVDGDCTLGSKDDLAAPTGSTGQSRNPPKLYMDIVVDCAPNELARDLVRPRVGYWDSMTGRGNRAIGR